LLPVARSRIFTAVDDAVRLARLQEFYTQTKGLTAQAASSLIGERELEEVPLIKSTRANADVVFAGR